MKKLLLIITVFLTSCTDNDGTKRVLEANGFTEVRTSGYRPLECGKDDLYCTGFFATSPTGKRVSGTVCKGFMKGATIRFD